jgi:hypothetical protein
MKNMADDDLFQAYFGTKTEYYNGVLEKIKANKIIVFGVFPFLLSIFWMLYRKMYLYAFVLTIIISIVSEFAESIYISNSNNINLTTITIVQNLSIAIIFGLFGNWLYISDAQRKINKLKNKYNNEHDLIEKIKQEGGTNWFAPLILLGLIILLLVAANYSQKTI